jgi:hypothetical protein
LLEEHNLPFENKFESSFSSNKILQISSDLPQGNHFKEKKRKTNQPTKLDIRKYD